MRVGRYLASAVLGHTGAVTLVLLAIIITGRFVKYLAQAATGELAADVLLPVMLFRLPGFLELLLPLGLFIGILMAYGRLYVESEMVVLSACGLGPRRLAWMTMAPASLITLVVALLSLYLTPLGAQRSEQLLSAPSALQGLQLVGEGRFQAWGGGDGVAYSRSIDQEAGTLRQIFVFETSPDEKGRVTDSVLVASSGRVQRREDLGARYLELEHGTQYTSEDQAGEPGQASAEPAEQSAGDASRTFTVARFETFGQRLPELAAKVRSKAVDGTPTEELLASPDPEAKAALHWRLSLIVMVPIVTLIAFSLSKTNHRRGRYLQLAPALLVHLCYLLLLASARTRVAEGEAGLSQLWLIHTVFLVFALVLLFASELRQKLQRA